jgi:hypothetical protein
MGYFPSNLIVLAGAILLVARLLLEGDVDFRVLVLGLAYHHVQDHLYQSSGLSITADFRRLLTALAAALAAGVLFWLN